MVKIKKASLCYAAALLLLVGMTTCISASEIGSAMPGHTIVLDAGHGGEDGGAVSITGITESRLNLEITQRLQEFLRLCGYYVVPVRDGDYSIYDSHVRGIAQKKISDLKNRVDFVNNQQNPILISIHQNHFSDGKYSGAQVFHAPNPESEMFAKILQDTLRAGLDPGNHRTAKCAQEVYLLKNIKCIGILVECGFLSNAREEQLLQIPTYQKRIVQSVTVGLTQYLQETE